jgi:hypothetical protein
VDGFADFGWIFLKLRLHSLGFLDEVSKFLQILFMLLMFMVKLLFVARNLVVEMLREEHKCLFLS